jgi:hypothetical protein
LDTGAVWREPGIAAPDRKAVVSSMEKYVIVRATRTVDAKTLQGWLVEETRGKKPGMPASILFGTKVEAEFEANRLILAEANRVKDA